MKCTLVLASVCIIFVELCDSKAVSNLQNCRYPDGDCTTNEIGAASDLRNLLSNFIEDHLSLTLKAISPVSFLQKTIFGNLVSSAEGGLTCEACKIGFTLVKTFVNQGHTENEVVSIIQELCITFKIEDGHICDSMIPLYKDMFFYVAEHLVLSPDQACGYLLGDSCAKVYNPYTNWTVKIPPAKPENSVSYTGEPKKVLKILHLTDLHHDPHYAVGSNADCSEPLCCRSNMGFPKDPKKRAGKWGDYRNCDIPLVTLENMLQHIRDTHSKQIEYIYWTGDFPSHDDWKQTRKSQIKSVEDLTDYLTGYFPNVPIFPALGNHEGNPVNSFPPPFVRGDKSISWLYSKLNSTWTKMLKKPAPSTVLKGAYYAIKPMKGFKIISLNMNYCNKYNWWLLVNTTDPADELKWFVGELYQSEKANERVHVIGHIPPPECPEVWLRNYNRIIHRFEKTITATFYGHTHKDNFHLHYAEDRAFASAYVAPSGTTYSFLNPAYRIYDVDGGNEQSSWDVLDHHNYFMNLTETNLKDEPKWQHEYSAKELYNMEALTPSDWDKVVTQLETNRTLFDLYYRFYYHSSDVSRTCDESCRQQMICGIRNTDPDRKIC